MKNNFDLLDPSSVPLSWRHKAGGKWGEGERTNKTWNSFLCRGWLYVYIYPRKGKSSAIACLCNAVSWIDKINQCMYDPSRNKTPLDFIPFTWLFRGVQYIHEFIHLFSWIFCNEIYLIQNYVALLLSLYTMTPFWIRSGISTANHGPSCNKIRIYKDV